MLQKILSHSKTSKPLITLFLLFLTISLQIKNTSSRISEGTCQTPIYERIIKHPSEYQNYLGKWYEIIRDKSTRSQKGTCASAHYCLNKRGFVSVLNHEVIGNRLRKTYGEAKLSSKDYNKFSVRFRGDKFHGSHHGEYRIIGTDFKNYSVAYSCTQINQNLKMELVWVLARDPTKISEGLLQKWIKYLEAKFGYAPEELFVTRHNSNKCKYFDENEKRFKRGLLC